MTSNKIMNLILKKLFVIFMLNTIGICILYSQVIPEGTYVIRSSVDKNHVVDLNSSITQDGNNIHIWTNNNTNAQRWVVRHSNGAIVMRSAVNYNYVIDLNGSITQDGNNIHIWQYNGTDAQRWFLQYDNGAYIIRSAVNQNFVLDLNSSNISDGNNIHIWAFNGTNAQRWVFQRVDGGNSGENSGNHQQELHVPQQLPCISCSGARTCSSCYGRGWVYFGSTYSGDNRKTTCKMCNGSGICNLCNGTGISGVIY